KYFYNSDKPTVPKDTNHCNPDGNCHPSLPEQKRSTYAQTDLVGTSFQPAACPELQQPAFRESPPPPKIISARSLQPHFTGGNPYPCLAIMSYFFNEDAENNTNVSSARAAVGVPTAMLPQRQSSLANNPEIMNCSASLENSSGNTDTTLSSLCIPPNFESSTSLMQDTGMNYPPSLENNSDENTPSSSLCNLPNFVLLPVEILVEAETNKEDGSEVMNNPVLLENDSGQASSSALFCYPNYRGYLGDPKRNIKLLDTHLVEAQKKRTPKHAARYLVRHLFSKEVLICSSVGAGFQGLQPLDPNKLAAMREYLAASFPNCDLSEHGKDWRSCISGIRSLIRYCKANNPMSTKKHADRTQGPMNPDAPAAADPNDERDGSESSSQTSQQAAASETTENGASLRNSEATPGGVNEPSADSSGMPCENLEYFGNPHRNIQIPHSILDIAKSKSRPELSARYLIRNLFTDEVLMKSNVYGHPGHGIYALNYNKIAALRGLLHAECG
uniref:BEN domain-containing protein n=1 Tax=Loxodonta africana TaxID=9785 RepID=G3T873_LOXAF